MRKAGNKVIMSGSQRAWDDSVLAFSILFSGEADLDFLVSFSPVTFFSRTHGSLEPDPRQDWTGRNKRRKNNRKQKLEKHDFRFRSCLVLRSFFLHNPIESQTSWHVFLLFSSKSTKSFSHFSIWILGTRSFFFSSFWWHSLSNRNFNPAGCSWQILTPDGLRITQST